MFSRRYAKGIEARAIEAVRACAPCMPSCPCALAHACVQDAKWYCHAWLPRVCDVYRVYGRASMPHFRGRLPIRATCRRFDYHTGMCDSRANRGRVISSVVNSVTDGMLDSLLDGMLGSMLGSMLSSVLNERISRWLIKG